MQLNILKHQLKELGQKHLVNLLKYKKYFRKTSLKQKGIGELFLNEIASKKPKNFLEIGVFHGVTARNVCELLHSIHGDEFKYIGLDLFGESVENTNEVIPNTKFNNPLKRIYFKYILRQDPYSIEELNILKHQLKELGQKHLVNLLKYKKYFRKTSLKQKGIGELFLNEIASKRPKNFLEIGVFHGVTARNVCELLYNIHGDEFKYIGLDLFGESAENTNEVIPNTKFNNPLKKIYFEYILKQDPYSIEAVIYLLKKFDKNIHLIKGNSNLLLKKIDMSKIDYVFLDGGHAYETVKIDLQYSKPVLENNGTILCDDYDLSYAPGVKQAIDEFIKDNNYKSDIIFDRFAKIEK